MLRLFRHIRQRLFLRHPEGYEGHVLEGRVSRYFGYAEGEMSGLLADAREVLIVVGNHPFRSAKRQTKFELGLYFCSAFILQPLAF